ncbi:uncharacterized protein [Macrobrachium rosenbergii]|uniref:uncharacterized protein n=1 Tax=Macrobrachium rosenbergii TaxID=79674 RepID=UPI0034D6A502
MPQTGVRSSERDVAKAAVINWVTGRLAKLPANAQAMYVDHQWSCKVQPQLMYRQAPIYEENGEDLYQAYQPRELRTIKVLKNSLSTAKLPPPPADQYVAFHRSPSLDRQGRRPYAQSSVNLHPRPTDVHYARFLSPQKYSGQPPNPSGFYRTASLDRLGRRNLAHGAGPGDPYLHSPRNLHHRHQGYYQQPPMVLQQKAEHRSRYDHHMNGQQSPYADRRSEDTPGGRFRSYSSAAQVTMKPSASPQHTQQSQYHDYQRNYQLPTPI